MISQSGAYHGGLDRLISDGETTEPQTTLYAVAGAADRWPCLARGAVAAVPDHTALYGGQSGLDQHALAALEWGAGRASLCSDYAHLTFLVLCCDRRRGWPLLQPSRRRSRGTSGGFRRGRRHG